MRARGHGGGEVRGGERRDGPTGCGEVERLASLVADAHCLKGHDGEDLAENGDHGRRAQLKGQGSASSRGRGIAADG